jgi:hypothetical protein
MRIVAEGILNHTKRRNEGAKLNKALTERDEEKSHGTCARHRGR